MSVPYIFSTVAGGTSIPLSELDANFAYLSTSPVLTSLTISGNEIVNGTSTIAGLLTANGGLSLTGALNLNGSAGANNQVVYSNSGIPSWTFINPLMLTTGHPTWDASGNLSAAGDIISGTGSFKSALAPNSQLIIGTNNFSVYLNSTNYLNVTSANTTISNNLLATGPSSTFNGLLTVLGGLSLSGSFNVNGSTGSSNSVLLINGATPTWASVGPSYLTAGGPVWDGSGNVSATLGIGSGTGTFYNTSASNCSLTVNTTAANTNINGSAVFSVSNLGNATVLNDLIVGGSLSVNGAINASGALTINGTITASGNITSASNITATGTIQGSSVLSTSGVFSKIAGGTPNITINSTGGIDLNMTSGGASFSSTGNLQLNLGASAYSIVSTAGYAGHLGIYFGLAPKSAGYVYDRGNDRLYLQLNGITQIDIDNTGNATVTGNVTSLGTGTSAFSGAISSAKNIQAYNALSCALSPTDFIDAGLYMGGGGGNNFVSSFVSNTVFQRAFVSVTNNGGGGVAAYWNVNGNYTIAGVPYCPGGGVWQATSDSRVKKNIQKYTLSTNDLGMINPVTYHYNGKYGTVDDGKTHYGFVAQELLDTPFKDMVSTYEHIDEETHEKTEIYSVNTTQLIFALLNAVKDLDARLKAKGI